MPSTSQKQHDFMELVLKDEKFVEKTKVNQDTVVELPSGYKFKKLDMSQLDAYVEFRQIASVESEYSTGYTKRHTIAEMIERLGEEGRDSAYVVVEERTGRVIGELFYRCRFEEDYFYLSQLTLLADFQGKQKQFSDGLMEQAIALANDKLFPEIRSIIDKENKKAIAYHIRHKFKYLKDFNAYAEIHQLVLHP